MKLYFFLFLLIIPSAFAMYGGEDYIKHFDKCERLAIFIEGEQHIDNGEYVINNENCTYKGSNTWLCNCTDNYYFNMSFKINTINNYNITFNWNYTYSESEPEQQDSQSGGGGSGGAGISYNCNLARNINSSYCEDEFCPRYLELSNCSKTPASLHLCCKTYFKNDTIPIKEPITDTEPEQEVKAEEPAQEQQEIQVIDKPPTEQKPVEVSGWFIVMLIVAILAVIGGIIFFIYKVILGN